MATRKKTPPLEKALSDLEILVTQLEEGQLPLEESLKIFEQGIQLCRETRETLTKAEQRVQILTQKNGEDYLEEFLVDNDNSLL